MIQSRNYSKLNSIFTKRRLFLSYLIKVMRSINEILTHRAVIMGKRRTQC